MTLKSSLLAKFEAANPKAAVLLSMINFPLDSSCHTDFGEENCVDETFDPPEALHSQSGALSEAKAWASSFAVCKVDFLIVYGVGLGYWYEALLPWLREKPFRRLIFIEDNLNTIRLFLESSRAEAFFDDPQVTLFYIESGIVAKEVIDTIAWNAYKRAWSCIPSGAYQRKKADVFEALVQKLSLCHAEVTDVLQEFYSPGETPLQNFGRNLFLWQKSKNASALFERFKHVPAIVVGAGPSLHESLPLLKTLSSKALIIAGGSAVGALLQAGIVPHFTATVDPNATQYIRMRQAQPFCLPIMYRSRALHEALMFHHGPLLYLRGGDGYPLVDYFEHALHVTGPVLEGGHSVSNMIIEIAYALGSRVIILAGYDLSYHQGNLYTQSVSESLSPKERASGGRGAYSETILGKTIDGRDVETETKWITEGKWIEQFQQLHPKLHIVQTSKDGLGIKEVEYLTFPEAVQKYCATSMDIDALMHLALEEAPLLSIQPEKVSEAIRELSDSLLEVSDILTKMREALLGLNFSKEEASWVTLEEHLRSTIAYKWVLTPYEAMHAKQMQMLAALEIRPQDDIEKQNQFERQAAIQRNSLFIEMTCSYQRFFSAIVSWACLNGMNLIDALGLAPYKEGAAIPKSILA